MATLIQIRRDTQTNWTTNDPILASGEIAFSTDQYKIKIGDGTSNWSALAYMTATPTEITNQINAAVAGIIDAAPAALDTLNELAAALNDDPNFFTTVANNLSNHELDSTNVHGIENTADLATKNYADTAVSTHNSDTTSVHGISNTANLVYTDDSRLSDARTPTSHNHTTSEITNFTEDVEDVVGGMVSNNTESGISVTYDDEAGKLNFNVNDPTITLSGDVSGSATMTDLGNVTITATVADDSHNHIIENVDGLQNALDTKLDSASYTASDVLTKIKTVDGSTSGLDSDLLDGQEGSHYLDWTNTTNKPDPVITLAGDLSGSVTLTDLESGTLTATIVADSVALGTDTTGNYVATVAGTDGVSVSGSGSETADVTIANTDKGSSQNIFKNVAVSGQSDIVADSNNDTLTVSGGTGISLTTNATTDTLTVTNSGVTSLTGTSNQISVSDSTGSVTLSTPQNIDSSASPTFAGATLDSIKVGMTNANEIDTTSGNLILDSAGGTVEIDDNLIVSGDFTVNGSTTTINATTITVDDKNIELGSVDNPTDTAANGGGITLKGTTDKTFNWSDATDSWTSSEHIDLVSGKVLKINGSQVLSATEFVGNSATVTDGVVTTGSYSDPSWITGLSWSKISSTPTTLSGYGISDAQPLDTELTALSGLTSEADALPYFTGAGTAAITMFTSFGRSLVDDVDAATARSTMGIGNVENVALSTWAGSTSVTTLGTIVTGTWNGSVIGDSYIDSGIARLASPSFTGSITLDSKANVDTTSTTISATTATTIDTLSASSYRSAEYLVQVTQDTKQTVSKIIMIHDGTTANISEYGVIELGGTRIPLTLSATISGTDVLLQATITDADTTNATVEVVRTAIVL